MTLGNNQYKADFTAWFVLQGVVLSSYLPKFETEQNDEMLKLRTMLANAAAKHRFLSNIVSMLPRSWQRSIGRIVSDPGRLAHFYLRKKKIEQVVRSALAQGNIKQMFILGAGLDVLPIVLAKEFPAIRFIEIDMDATLQFKCDVFAQHGVALPHNLEMIYGDLRNPLADILKHSSFIAGEPTLWLAEGLLMFLSEADVRSLLANTSQLSGAESHAVFTAIASKKSGGTLARLIQTLYLAKEKSPFKWSLNEPEIGDYLKHLGYHLHEHIPYKTINKEFSATPDYEYLDEYIVVATKA